MHNQIYYVKLLTVSRTAALRIK